MPPSAISGTPVPLSASATLFYRADLRYADAGNDTRGADRPGPMPTLTPSAPTSPVPCGSGGGDIAADDLDVREAALDPAHAIEHTLRMAMRGIDDDHVDAGLGKQPARSRVPAPTPMAAPTSRRPWLSLAASGARWTLRMS